MKLLLTNKNQIGKRNANNKHALYSTNTSQTTSELFPIGNKKDVMSIHSNEPSRPPNRKEIVSWKEFLVRSVENTDFKNSKSQYTQEHEQ